MLACNNRTSLPRRQDYGPSRKAQFLHSSSHDKDVPLTRRRQFVGQIGASKRIPVVRTSSTFKVQLIKPTGSGSNASYDKLLVYFPGTDGTGQAILPQIPALHNLGYDIWCLYMPPDDRSDWEQLTTQLTLLLRQLQQHWREIHQSAAGQQDAPSRLTIVAESFGCCLALRLAATGAGPELLDRLVLLNPATCFKDSLSGLSSLIAATNLLSLFPRDWYAVAQTTLLPLLVDGERVDESNQKLLQSMILMEPPPSNQSFGFGTAKHPRPAAAGAGQTGSNDDDGDDARPSGLYYAPAAAANFRANLLRSGDPGIETLQRVTTPVLLITSARDRLLPSIIEGARLERTMPNTRRHILPDSGHAALLERDFNLAAVLQVTGFTDPAAIAAPRQSAGAAPAKLSTASSTTSLRTQSLTAQNGLGVDDEYGMTGSEGIGISSGVLATADIYRTSPSLSRAVPSSVAVPLTANAPLPEEGVQQLVSSRGGVSATPEVKGSRSRRGNSLKGSRGDGGEGKAAPPEEGQPPYADVNSAFDEWCQKLAPWRDIVSPVVRGFEHLPQPGSPAFSRPMLFVGNHQKMGFYDTPFLIYELYVRGYRVRGLAHPGHWAGPFGRWFESFGAVKASPMAAFRLLRSSEKVLLFPGGAKEVVKKRGQEYTLLWKESPDFVRLAARCNALIVPFAAVGADDAYDVIMDTDEVIAHPVLGPLTTGLLNQVSTSLDPVESIFPITRMPVVGLPTPIPIPNLQRLYFQFAPIIDPCHTNINDPQQVQELYDGVKGTVTQCMAELLEVRTADEESNLGARLAKSWRRIAPVLGAAASPPPLRSND